MGKRRSTSGHPDADTQAAAYAQRLEALQSPWWKRVLDVQRPYRWNLRRLQPGFVLDIGCGLGRNLAHLHGHGVGIDHNAEAVRIARARGLCVFEPDEFARSDYARPASFDSLLLAHVVEHMTPDDAEQLLRSHLGFLRPGGSVILITPQERGFNSDPTHVHFMDLDALESLVRRVGLEVRSRSSFPFPRLLGRVFVYNEFVMVARAPAVSG